MAQRDARGRFVAGGAPQGTRFRIKIDSAGIGQVLKSAPVQQAIKELADQVAQNVDGQNLVASSPWKRLDIPAPITAVVTTAITDRARATVAIDHPAGAAMQARHGVLTKAASAAGLEVKHK